MEKEFNIQFPPAEESVYDRLQRQSLEWVQQMSGKIWTDYNVHDPGVTTLDILNYTLSELNYRLSFPLEDYLTEAGNIFVPEAYGLFNPTEVFSMQPVTPGDYQDKILDALDTIEDVRVFPHPALHREECLGWYDIEVELSPYIEPSQRETEKRKIRETIYELFHCHRNLGENLYRISFIQREKLTLCGDIETDGSVKPEELFISIYIEALSLFAPGVHYEVEDLPVRLYKKVKQLPGVTVIRSLEFVRMGKPGTSYTIAIQEDSDIRLHLFRDRKQIPVDVRQILRRLHARNNLRHVIRQRKEKPLPSAPVHGRHHTFSHYSIQNDYPGCYGVNSKESARQASEQRKMQLRQFKAYLLVMDIFLAKGIEEINRLSEWMALNTWIAQDKNLRLDAPELIWDILVDGYEFQQDLPSRESLLLENKHRLLDTLDKLYGENSNPPYLRLPAPRQNLERRVNFLKQLPYLLRDRYKGIYLLDASSTSGLEQYLTTLLGLSFRGKQAYVIEHLLLYPLLEQPPGSAESSIETIDHTGGNRRELPLEFSLSVLLPSAAEINNHPELDLHIEELLRERIPAHIEFELYWLNNIETEVFRHHYQAWRDAWASRDKQQINWTTGILSRCLIQLRNRI